MRHIYGHIVTVTNVRLKRVTLVRVEGGQVRTGEKRLGSMRRIHQRLLFARLERYVYTELGSCVKVKVAVLGSRP